MNRDTATLALPEVLDAEGHYIKTWGEIVDIVLAAVIADTDKETPTQ